VQGKNHAKDKLKKSNNHIHENDSSDILCAGFRCDCHMDESKCAWNSSAMTLTSNMHLNRGDTTIGVKITGTYQPRDSAGPHRVINIEACDDHGTSYQAH